MIGLIAFDELRIYMSTQILEPLLMLALLPLMPGQSLQNDYTIVRIPVSSLSSSGPVRNLAVGT